MTRFEVWAPAAIDSVEVEVGEERYALERSRDRAWPGWWMGDVASAGPGDDYRFALDGGDAAADPRSQHQPDGIDGPSRIVDHGAYEWADHEWRGVHLPSAVIYELHVGTFTADGTFEAVIERLDHLVDLGVDLIELLPVAESSGRWGWGYDGVFTSAPHHAYGEPEELKRLVDACHARGIGVLLDVVYNHLGPAGNVLPRFGPYFTARHSTPWGDALNFDGPLSGPVRRYFVDAALGWLRDYHLDGLRLDAVHAIVDSSAVHLLEELADETEDLAALVGRPLWLIAELDLNDPRYVRHRDGQGFGLHAQWVDEVHHAVHAVVAADTKGYYEDFGSVADIATALSRGYVYAGEPSAHRQRAFGRPPTFATGHRFVACLQNHDQVGNRAAGERITALTTAARAKVGAALILLSPFVPMLFMGEEWGASTPWQYFTDHQDPDLAAAVTEGRTHEFGSFGWAPADVPDPQDPATFERSKLDWQEVVEPDHAELLDWYRACIGLRKAHPDLAGGRLAATTAAVVGDGGMAVGRGRLAILANLGMAPITFANQGRVDVLLSSGGDGIDVEERRVVLPPDALVVLGPVVLGPS